MRSGIRLKHSSAVCSEQFLNCGLSSPIGLFGLFGKHLFGHVRELSHFELQIDFALNVQLTY